MLKKYKIDEICAGLVIIDEMSRGGSLVIFRDAKQIATRCIFFLQHCSHEMQDTLPLELT